MLDFLRIARVRRMLKAIEKHDIEKMKKLADAGIKTRNGFEVSPGKTRKRSLNLPKRILELPLQHHRSDGVGAFC